MLNKYINLTDFYFHIMQIYNDSQHPKQQNCSPNTKKKGDSMISTNINQFVAVISVQKFSLMESTKNLKQDLDITTIQQVINKL